MALTYKSGQFAANTTTGNQTIDTGTGITGKAIIFFWSNQTADGFNAGMSGGKGFAVSSTQRAAIAWASDDNLATTNTGKDSSAAACILILSDGTPTEDGLADFVDFTTGGAGRFTINWTNAPTNAVIIKYVFLGGSDITNAFIGQFTGPAAAGTGNKAFTGVGFQGNLGFFLTDHATATGTAANLSGGLGAAISSTERFALSWADRDNTTHSGNAETVIDNTKCLISYDPKTAGSAAQDNIADFVSWDTDGFTLNYTQVTTGSILFWGLILKGTFQADINQQARPTATGDQDITTPEFQPEGVMIFGGIPTVNATETADMHVIIGAGEATGTVRDDSVWTSSDGTINSDVNMRTLSTKIYNQNTNPATEAAAADLTAWLSNGFRLNWTAVNASAVLFDHVVLGSAPGIQTKTGNFTKATGAAPVSQSVTGIGFRPKALILFVAPATAAGISLDYEFGLGFSDGTDSYSISGASEDGVFPDVDRRHAAKALVILLQNATLAAECDLTSFDEDGFTLNWTTNNASAYIIHYFAIGGSTLTNAKVATFNSSASTGNQSITGTGFQPDIVFIIRIISSTTIPQTTTSMFPCLGAATSSTNRWCIALSGDDFVSVSDTARKQETDSVIQGILGSGSVALEADFVSMNTDGFTINWVTASTARIFGYLALKGGLYSVGADTQKTSTGTKATTGLTFTPKGLMLFSFNNAASTAAVASNRVSIGSASAAGTEGSIWVGDTDGESSTLTNKSTSTTKIIQMIDTSEPTAVDAEADLSSFNSNGFTLDWTTADATARQFVYIAIGDTLTAAAAAGADWPILTGNKFWGWRYSS